MREFLDELKPYATPCNLAIMGITVLCYILQVIFDNVSGTDAATSGCALAWWLVFEEHQYYRLLTYMFLHGSVSHLFNNMLVLGFTGSFVERQLGALKYAAAYISTGLVAGLTSAAYNRWCFNNSTGAAVYYSYSLGASGAVFGVVGALFYIVMINRGRVQGVTLRQLVLFIILSIYAGISSTGIDNTAHIGGVIFGIISAAILYRRDPASFGD